MKPILGVIGGSGLYDLPGLHVEQQMFHSTPFGDPSGPMIIGRVLDRRIMFIARHGDGHTLTPDEVNYRANVYMMRCHGATHLLGVNAVGSLAEHNKPGDVVFPDQFVDYTRGRKNTFFGSGLVGHVSMANPTCLFFRHKAHEIARNLSKQEGFTAWHVGKQVVINGPQFSTIAESEMFRDMSFNLIGMTSMPEAKLAREAGLCYASMALVTDYDCWHGEAVTAEQVMNVMKKNSQVAKDVIFQLAQDLPERNCDCATAGENAIVSTDVPYNEQNQVLFPNKLKLK